MTCIVYRNGILAADSKISGKDFHHWGSSKKVRKIRGYLIGAAGDYGICELFLQKFDPKIIEEKRIVPVAPANKSNSGFEALVITPKGKVLFMEEDGIVAQVKTCGYIAIGTGEVIAMAAMDGGATAIEAVKIAIKREATCGGRITYVKLRS